MLQQVVKLPQNFQILWPFMSKSRMLACELKCVQFIVLRKYDISNMTSKA